VHCDQRRLNPSFAAIIIALGSASAIDNYTSIPLSYVYRNVEFLGEYTLCSLQVPRGIIRHVHARCLPNYSWERLKASSVPSCGAAGSRHVRHSPGRQDSISTLSRSYQAKRMQGALSLGYASRCIVNSVDPWKNDSFMLSGPPGRNAMRVCTKVQVTARVAELDYGSELLELPRVLCSTRACNSRSIVQTIIDNK
jgi:hypothetical protein